MPESKREPEFVVTDRRKFTTDGEVRSEASPSEEPSTHTLESRAASRTLVEPPVVSAFEDADDAADEPSEAEHREQKQAYEQSGRELDDMIAKAGQPESASNMVMTFERLTQSLYMTALLQLGLLREKEDQPMRPDIISARQTIDTLGILQEKTKGNLSDQEAHLLQNALFELRMAFLEVTNAITRAARAPHARGQGPLR